MDSNRLFKIDKCVGDKEMFKKDLSRYMSEFPLVQLIFSYYLSGPIRQILVHQSEGVGEYGLVTCITGETGSGKTTVTTTLQNILFGKGRMVSNNTTSKALYSIIKNSGICPVVRDDSSTDTQNGISHIKDKVMDIYNIASGKGRVTCNTEEDMTLYAPFIESREENWGMADMVKSIRQVEGYKFRVLEIHCNKGDLTKDSQTARDFSALNGKYSGMSVLFLDYLVDKYSEQDIHQIYSEYVKEMDNLLTENELESRYANRTAVILTAARIAGEAFEISMDVEKIKMVMVDSIRAFERRLTAAPDNWELKLLYNRFKAKNTEGLGTNDSFIVDAVGNYNHKNHYVSFLQRKSGEFVIPAALMGIFISEDVLMEPSFWGYDNNKLYTDVGEIKGEHWEAILQEWGDQGILIKNKKRATYTQTVKLNGIPTTCYHFNWTKIAQQFGDKSTLDMTRFAHDSEDEIINDF